MKRNKSSQVVMMRSVCNVLHIHVATSLSLSLTIVFELDEVKYDEELVPVHVVGDVSRGARLECQVAPVREH